MKVTISLNIETSSACADFPGGIVRNAIAALARYEQECGQCEDSRPIIDDNGNKIGTVELSAESDD